MASKYVVWKPGEALPFDERNLKRFMQSPNTKEEKKKIIRTSRIDHVHFYVKDLSRTFHFYNSLFGFDIYEGQVEEGFIIMGNKDIKLCLMENPSIENLHNGGFYHFGFHVRKYEDVKKLLQEVNLQFSESEWEYSRSIYIKDPDGYTIELSEKKGGGL